MTSPYVGNGTGEGYVNATVTNVLTSTTLKNATMKDTSESSVETSETSDRPAQSMFHVDTSASSKKLTSIFAKTQTPAPMAPDTFVTQPDALPRPVFEIHSNATEVIAKN